MSTTELLKEEIAATPPESRSAQMSSVSAMLRFGGTFTPVPGTVIVDVHTDCAPAASWLQRSIKVLFGHDSQVLSAPGTHPGSRAYLVRVARGGPSLAHQAGLVSSTGQLVRGLPAPSILGSAQTSVGLWRGAFMTQGSVLTRPKGAALEVRCPSLEAGLALAGAARRFGVHVRPTEQGGGVRMLVRTDAAVDTMLAALGATKTQTEIANLRVKRRKNMATYIPDFANANESRSLFGAQRTAQRLVRAYEILGESIPAHLRHAGDLRLDNPTASLERLGQLAEPPMTKDAIAGKLRRLLAMADARAAELGVAGTVPPDDEG